MSWPSSLLQVVQNDPWSRRLSRKGYFGSIRNRLTQIEPEDEKPVSRLACYSTRNMERSLYAVSFHSPHIHPYRLNRCFHTCFQQRIKLQCRLIVR